MTRPTDLDSLSSSTGSLNEPDAGVVRLHLDGCYLCRALVTDIGPATCLSSPPLLLRR